MSNTIREQITGKCAELDIPLVGFASAKSWDTPRFEPWIPMEFQPRALWPEVKTVIVMGIPVSLPALETTPSIWYHEVYRTVNTLLDTSAYRIALFLGTRGFPSISLPRDGYGSIEVLKERPVAFFSHRHAAYLAGLGTFGVNNMLLTPQFGPRVRFTTLFTTAEIRPDPVMEADLCIRCMRCSKVCPVNAIGSTDYPGGTTDKRMCAARSSELNKQYISPCGLCVRVCPIGEDRIGFQREDLRIYNEKPDGFSHYHATWNHVRSYGGK